MRQFWPLNFVPFCLPNSWNYRSGTRKFDAPEARCYIPNALWEGGTKEGAVANIIVCVKQVPDPETPASAFRIDADRMRMAESLGVASVLNGFDENAVEAALRIKDAAGGRITVLSLGSTFAADVVKKPLSMGADDLVLLQDEAFDDLDSYGTALALVEAIKKIDGFDLVLCGRQASDWDNAQVPLGIAELLGLPCITVAQRVEVDGSIVTAERVLSGGYEVVEADMPALVTVSNELGEPRYPTLRGIMAAGRKQPTVWTADDLGIDPALLERRVRTADLFVPVSDRQCEIIEGEDDADSGRLLALRLREEKLI